MPVRTIDGRKIKLTAEEAARVDLLRNIDRQKPRAEEETDALARLREQAQQLAIQANVDRLTIDEPGCRRVTVFVASTQPWEALDLEAARDLDPGRFALLFISKRVYTPTEELTAFMRGSYEPGSPQHELQAALVRAKRANTTWRWRVSPPRQIQCRHCGTLATPVKGSPLALCAECQPLYNMKGILWEISRGELSARSFNNRRARKLRERYLMPVAQAA